MPDNSHDVLIIGAGLSGLSCALELQKQGQKILLLEKSDEPGGRVRTDNVDGFQLDRGFQVYLSAYPTAGRLLDLPALDLGHFEPGAMVYHEGKLHRVMDIFRRPQHLLASALAPIGGLMDKARVARLRWRVKNSSQEQIANREDLSTEDYLRREGFSAQMIDRFFRSFYGGIFLERELQTSSRMFEFTFKMFTEGAATLPALGMGQLSQQLANRLPSESIRYQCPVKEVNGNQVTLSSGEILEAATIVLATPAHITSALLPDLDMPDLAWRSVTTLYFSAPKSPLDEAVIALNGSGQGRVNNVAVLSDVRPEYAPKGQALISVSLLGTSEQADTPNLVKQELIHWFGKEVTDWKHLRTDLIPHALPDQKPNALPCPRPAPPLYLCGDYQTSASIEGAIISGQDTARKILGLQK